jgi:hypothetical protein
MRNLHRVGGNPITAEAQGLYAKKDLLRREGVQHAAYLHDNLNAQRHSERYVAKIARERKAHGPIARLGEVREARARFSPVKTPGVDDYATDRRPVAA